FETAPFDLSGISPCIELVLVKMEETVGFEPTWIASNGFQDRRFHLL
ncbi:23669_t:CDS:1, partial [Gigaspora rosea]